MANKAPQEPTTALFLLELPLDREAAFQAQYGQLLDLEGFHFERVSPECVLAVVAAWKECRG